MKKTLTLTLLLTAALLAARQDTSHHDGVNNRGDHVMGFSHEKATHHFLLWKDGGVIQVEANSADDTETRDAIRFHLQHIAGMFAAGNFQAPMLIHGQTPPGVPVMIRLKDQIAYTFAATGRGGRVLIATSNPEALKAIQEFLKFQIADHQTGDPLTVSPR